MALTDEGTGMVMPVAPAYGGYGGGMGFGGDWAWIIILLLAFNGGWGGGFGGYGGQVGTDFPWILNGQNGINANTNNGFDHAATQAALGDLSNAVTSGFGNVATQLCGGFAGVNASVTGAQNSISQQLSNNEIASLNRSFAEQTANTQGFSNIAAQLAQCCCDNRLATSQTQNIIQSEAATTRSTIQSAVQTVLDRLCQDKIDAKNEKIVELNNRINSLEANNYIQNALTAQTQYFVNRYPVPTTTTAAGT